MGDYSHLTRIPRVPRRAAVEVGETADASIVARPASYFMRGGKAPLFQQWRPALRDMQDAISESWDAAAARALESIANSGFISGAIDQAVATDIGLGLRLKAQPENDLFGASDADARAWARMVEIKFGLWANNAQECDIAGRQRFGQMQASAYRMWFPTGEILAEYPWRKRPWNQNGTKVRVVSPHRLSRESNEFVGLTNGVFINADGMPVAYRARRKDRILGEITYDVQARDANGRQRVQHIYDGLPETIRGISVLAPAMRIVRQYDQFTDATLTAAIVQSLFAATIKSDAPTDEVLSGLLTDRERAEAAQAGIPPVDAWLAASQGYYENASIDVGVNGRLGFLFPGDELQFHSSNQPGPDYRPIASFLMLEFARCLGLDYASATGDYAGSSYYTINRSNADTHEIRRYRREHIMSPFCQAAYEGWLEEQVETGRVEFPGGIANFRANRAAACRAEWRGGPKPIADDLKFAKAFEVFERLGFYDEFFASALLGLDYEDTLQGRAAAAELRRQYGVPEPVRMGVNANGSGSAGSGGGSVEDGDSDGQ